MPEPSASPTVTEVTATADPPREPTPPDVHHLVVVWSAEGAARAGELLTLPSESRGLWSLVGRGEGGPDDPHPRLLPTRHRPGRIDPGAPLGDPHLSRVQLRVRAGDRAGDGEGLEVERLGRGPLLHDGREVQRAVAAPGETLQIGQRLLLLVARRSAWIPAALELETEGAPPFPFGAADAHGLVGESPALWRTRAQVRWMGPRPEHVLVSGPAGAGKQLVARAIHALSPGAAQPPMTRSAASLAERWLDDGAVTGGATLLLDELGDLPPALQARLARWLDEKEQAGARAPSGAGGSARAPAFRLIATTGLAPERLRPELLAWLPLRTSVDGLNTRREDIPLLAAHLLSVLVGRAADPDAAARAQAADGRGGGQTRMSLSFMDALVRHRYATNARELQVMLLAALGRAPAGVLTPADGGRAQGTARETARHTAQATATISAGGDGGGQAGATQRPGPVAAPTPEPAVVQDCLDRHRGNIELAWRELGLSSRHALARLVSKHALRAGRRWRPPPSPPHNTA
jgi:DNA-binding NtrC family response regulator